MPEENLINGEDPRPELAAMPEALERSAAETNMEAEQTIADIDKAVSDFRAQEAVTNPDAVHELESVAQSSLAQVQEVLHSQGDVDLEATLKENTKTPEYQKAQEYANQVRVKIDSILQSISDDRLRGKAQLKLDKISKSFWFFCKEMALNEMDEFDYNSKIAMMESKYQKVLAEIDIASTDFLAKDQKKAQKTEVPKAETVESPVTPAAEVTVVEGQSEQESPAQPMASTESNTVQDPVKQKAYEVVAGDGKIPANVRIHIDQALDNFTRATAAIQDKSAVPLLQKQYDNFLSYCSNMLASKSKSAALKATLIESEYEGFIKRMEDIFDAAGNAKESAASVGKSASVTLDDWNIDAPKQDESTASAKAEQPTEDPASTEVNFLNNTSYQHIPTSEDRAGHTTRRRKSKSNRSRRGNDGIDVIESSVAEEKYESYDDLDAEAMQRDKRFLSLVFKHLVAYLQKQDSNFAARYNGEFDETLRLKDKDGNITEDKIISFSTDENYAAILPDVLKEFADLYPEDYKKFKKSNKKDILDEAQSTVEKLEKDLGYLDIDPKAIWEKLTPEDMQTLQILMKAGDQSKINAFYQAKIQEVLTDQKKAEVVNEELLKQIAESVNQVLERTITLEAQRQLDGGLIDQVLGAQKGQRAAVARKIAKNMLIMGGASLAVSGLGLATGGIGVAATALGMSGLRLILRKIDKTRAETTPDSVKEREKIDAQAELDRKKAEVLASIFTADNLENLRRQLSGHIANTLREQTSGRALEALRAYEQADGTKEKTVLDARFRDVEKELYLNALTKVRAENPDLSPEQQQNMALTMSLTLAQHERGENLARRRLEEIRQSKPALYQLIEKYNLYSTGQKPEGMNKEEESLWQKSKYDLMSLGIGTAVGAAIRTSGIARVALGAVAGGGLGYKVGEWMEQRDQKKALAEIVKMLEESEKVIKDIEFPSDAIEQLKKDSVFVQSKLDLGLLDSDPLLKSRAENFIHQVQKIELANQESLNKLLSTISDRTDSRAQQVEDDLQRIGSKIKKRKLLATIGGAAVGGALAWAAGELFGKKEAVEKSSTPNGETEPTPPPPSPSPEVKTPSSFADVIDSSKVSGSDSIWRSTHQIFEDHPKELGYTGDLNDHDALSKWAENQTANVVQRLNQEQGGNLADLVHDGDQVKIELVDGKPVLSFEAASGVAAGHLPDSNVADLAAEQKFGDSVEHNLAIDPKTGDQFLEIKSGSDVYRVYDWDRDARPNIVFPDGHTQEMSVGELNQFLTEKNILSVENTESVSPLESAASTTPEIATATIADQKAEDFINNGGAYTRDVYEAAKNSGHLPDLVSAVVKGEDQAQTGDLVSDYARDNGWSEDKIRVFLNAMRSGEKIDLSSGQFDASDPDIIIKNMQAFEKSALDSFDKVKDMPADRWMPARIGNDYFNIQKVHGGVWPFRSDHFLVDANGDFKIDAIKLDDASLRAAFRRDNFDPKALGQK